MRYSNNLFLLFLCTISAAARAGQAGESDRLLPRPAKLTRLEGRLQLPSNFAVTLIGPADARAHHGVERLLQRLQQEHGVRGCIKPCTAPQLVTVRWETPGLPVQSLGEDESYDLTVKPGGATLHAKTPLGVLRGVETLAQGCVSAATGCQLPAMRLHDQPRFVWRGLMIDTARHFIPVEALKRNLDAMASVKLNVFHWHLTDDQGFRLESRRFPELHRQGSGGKFYTQEQAREVVAYARDRGIRVVPEFDMPGHTHSWLIGHPELASAPGPYLPASRWGVLDAALNPASEATYAFIDTFLGEMAEIFIDPYVHIGGDEVTGKHWAQNPAIVKFMQAHALADAHALQTYFIDRVARLAARRGKQIAGWDEIAHPALAAGSVIQSWRGRDNLRQSLKAGHFAIVSHGYYLDSANSAAHHYLNDPDPGDMDLDAEAQGRLLGGEACQWSELVNEITLDANIWPRTAAVAERFWSPRQATQDVADMYRRMRLHSDALHRLGLTHRSAQQARLAELADTPYLAPLQELASVLEPRRFNWSPGFESCDIPLDGLSDALPPESDAARQLQLAVDALLTTPPFVPQHTPVRAALQRLYDNHAAVKPLLSISPQLFEALEVSRTLRDAARVGLEALDHLGRGTSADARWIAEARSILAGATKVQAGLSIAVVPAIAALVDAAEALPP